MGLLPAERSYAQSDEDDDEDDRNSNNNVIGQDGDGNEASQIDETSQETNQNSMCVSGESTSLSCNNLSSELTGVGIPGTRGDQGEQGPQGPIGPIGPEGPQGETGATGSTGPRGETGETGPQGPPGVNGTDGEKGPQGEQGIQGATGPMGNTGHQGSQGPPGEIGPQGPAGPSTPSSVYTATGTGQIDENGNGVAIAICDTGDVVVGGGFEARAGLDNIQSLLSRQGGDGSWSVAISYEDDPDGFIDAYARCLDVTP